MLIKKFCEVTGLPRDTVRFYVKLGLLTPTVGSRPGNRYRVFDAAQVERAKLIRAAQGLGFTLKEIAELGRKYSAGRLGSETKKAVLRFQIDRLRERRRELVDVLRYLEAKLRWVEAGERGVPPAFAGGSPLRAQRARNGRSVQIAPVADALPENGRRRLTQASLAGRAGAGPTGQRR